MSKVWHIGNVMSGVGIHILIFSKNRDGLTVALFSGDSRVPLKILKHYVGITVLLSICRIRYGAIRSS